MLLLHYYLMQLRAIVVHAPRITLVMRSAPASLRALGGEVGTLASR